MIRRTLTMASLLAALTLAFAPPAYAASKADKAKAKEHYKSGATHFSLGEFEDAILEFKTAYKLFPEPVFLFNIAQCYRQLGDVKQALFFYRSYLTNRPDAPNRGDVESVIGELEKLIGGIEASIARSDATKTPKPDKDKTPKPDMDETKPDRTTRTDTAKRVEPEPDATPTITDTPSGDDDDDDFMPEPTDTGTRTDGATSFDDDDDLPGTKRGGGNKVVLYGVIGGAGGVVVVTGAVILIAVLASGPKPPPTDLGNFTFF